jgi:transcriptional regulator
MARANPQWRRIAAGAEALAIFLGPNTYVTPSWYPTKQQTGEVVPTWNFLAVHVYGEIRFFDDPARLRKHVGTLTDAHEAARPAPWAASDAPAAYLDKMIAAIVGFDLVITRLEGKWKMSQNRPAQDIAGVREGLRREDDVAQRAVAGVMAKSARPPGSD